MSVSVGISRRVFSPAVSVVMVELSTWAQPTIQSAASSNTVEFRIRFA